MADTQTAPAVPQGPVAPGESMEAAHNAILGLLDSDEEQPKDEEEQTSEEESAEETQDELSEEDEGVEDPEVEEEDEEVEEELEEESEEEDVYSVRVDGEDHEVTLDELLKGYSRQSDYTKKTQEVANQRGQIEQLANQYNSEVAQIQA